MNADWFYSDGEDRKGPVTEDELKRRVADGQLKPADLVWQDGMADWVEARTVESLFPKRKEPRRDPDEPDRPARRRFDPDGTPTGRSSRRRDDDDDEVRPSRRGRPRDEIDDDDRPPVRRREFDDRDDIDDRPRRKKNEKPGQVTTVGILLLVGGILGLITMASVTLGSLFFCCLWPGIYFELVWGILAIIRGINMLNRDDQGPPRTLAILQIICIINGDIINCVLGIVALVMLNDKDTVAYYRKKGFES